MRPILEVKNLTKKYNGTFAIDHISFAVNAGEIVGLLGPNGAGKTTTIHMLLSLLEPTEGSIKVFGKDLSKNREKILERMNFAAAYAFLPYNLTIYENLQVFAMMYGVKNRSEKITKLLNEFQIEKFRNVRAGTLSSGEQMRLILAKAFLNEPKLLLLDEPTAYLDPAIAWDIRNDIFYRMRELKGAVLWTSHNMAEIEEMCDRVIFLAHGVIVREGAPKTLCDEFGKKSLEDVFLELVKHSEKHQHL